MKFKQWLEAILSADQLRFIQDAGYAFVDEFSSGSIEMFLLKDDAGLYPEKFKYHLAVQKTGANVFSVSQQLNRPKGVSTNMIDSVKSLEPILKKISEWIDEYGKLVIASTNPELTNKWFNNLVISARYFDMPLDIETHSFYGHTFHLVGKA